MAHAARYEVGKIKFNYYDENISAGGTTGVERELIKMKSLDFIGGAGDRL